MKGKKTRQKEEIKLEHRPRWLSVLEGVLPITSHMDRKGNLSDPTPISHWMWAIPGRAWAWAKGLSAAEPDTWRSWHVPDSCAICLSWKGVPSGASPCLLPGLPDSSEGSQPPACLRDGNLFWELNREWWKGIWSQPVNFLIIRFMCRNTEAPFHPCLVSRKPETSCFIPSKE